jgi:orotate phosphoribosyltransferase
VSRGNVDAAGLGVDRFVYLLEYKIPAWPASTCQLCRAGVPINTRYAHGREYLARQAEALLHRGPNQPQHPTGPQ